MISYTGAGSALLLLLVVYYYTPLEDYYCYYYYCCYTTATSATTPYEKSRAAMIMILSVRALMAYASRRFRPELKRIEKYGRGQAKSLEAGPYS